MEYYRSYAARRMQFRENISLKEIFLGFLSNLVRADTTEEAEIEINRIYHDPTIPYGYYKQMLNEALWESVRRGHNGLIDLMIDVKERAFGHLRSIEIPSMVPEKFGGRGSEETRERIFDRKDIFVREFYSPLSYIDPETMERRGASRERFRKLVNSSIDYGSRDLSCQTLFGGLKSNVYKKKFHVWEPRENDEPTEVGITAIAYRVDLMPIQYTQSGNTKASNNTVIM